MQQHAEAMLRESLADTSSQLRHYKKCPVAKATRCSSMPKLCCEKAWLIPQASLGTIRRARLRSNRMQRHAEAMLRDSLADTSGRLKHYKRCLVAKATGCSSMPKLCCEKARLILQASSGTIRSARLRRQPDAAACLSYAARKLADTSSQLRHYKKCPVAKQPNAAACRSYAARKLG
jgi:hypothetical protein